MEESKKGGKRVNAGRKPLSDPKKPITLYVPKSKILVNGGEEKLKLRIYDAISKDFSTTHIVENKEIVAEYHKPIVETRKSVQEWIDEKREILIPELYQDFIDRLNKTKTLTDKEKQTIKYA